MSRSNDDILARSGSFSYNQRRHKLEIGPVSRSSKLVLLFGSIISLLLLLVPLGMSSLSGTKVIPTNEPIKEFQVELVPQGVNLGITERIVAHSVGERLISGMVREYPTRIFFAPGVELTPNYTAHTLNIDRTTAWMAEPAKNQNVTQFQLRAPTGELTHGDHEFIFSLTAQNAIDQRGPSRRAVIWELNRGMHTPPQQLKIQLRMPQRFTDIEAKLIGREIKERGDKSEVAETTREIPVQIQQVDIPAQIDPVSGAVIADRKEKLVGVVLTEEIRRFEVLTIDVSWRQSLDGAE